MSLIRLLLPRLSLKVPDLILIQALGSFQGWSQAEQPPKTVEAKSANERAASPLVGQISLGGVMAGGGPGLERPDVGLSS